jgi:hypothetical protein
MVTTDALVGLYQHYDDQANTPFTGAARARRIADRLYAILNKTYRPKLLRALPKNASDAVEQINQMSDEEFEAFITTTSLPSGTACETESDEPRYELTVDHDEGNDWYSLRWNVHLTRSFGGSSIRKTVAAYVYQNAAETLVIVLPKDQETLELLWTNL